METQRNWKKVKPNKYLFWVGEKKVGELELQYAKWKHYAIANIENQLYTIERHGFWKNKITITNDKGELRLKAYSPNWFGNQMAVEFQNKKLTLKIRNNPLAEWVISDQNTAYIAYGLKAQNGSVYTQIATVENNSDYLLDFLLWYLFHPIAQENTADNIIFQSVMLSD